jgi:hypothetical protein
MNLGYTQVRSQVMLNAKLKPGLSFQAQAKWQHQISQYMELLAVKRAVS